MQSCIFETRPPLTYTGRCTNATWTSNTNTQIQGTKIHNQTLWNKFGYTTSAFTEGWALYAEKLAVEAGLVPDPYDRIGSLQSELFRAARLVVDTGIHAKRWTREGFVKNTAKINERAVNACSPPDNKVID